MLDLATALPAHPEVGGGSLDALLAAGRPAWERVHEAAARALERGDGERLPLADVALHLPWTVRDYVDFYASEHHARRVSAVLRGADLLPEAWKHLPIGYHGRAGTVVVSGTPVRRPSGLRRTSTGSVVLGPTARLDLEAEVGFLVGAASDGAVPLAGFADTVFGVCLLNDWSARELQAFEYVPLGPFSAKAFATSVSPWVVPLAALEAARVAPPPRDVPLAAHLDDAGAEPWGLDLALEVEVAGTVVSRPPAATTYWTGAQQLAHLSLNTGVRSGDLYASGTVSGPDLATAGCLLELTAGGREPLALPGGRALTWLEDGDEVVVRGTAPAVGGGRLDLGEVRGRVAPAADAPG